jgi:hypothetical protein
MTYWYSFIFILLKAIVSFGKVDPVHKEKVEQNGLSIYSWEEFLQLVRFSLPEKITDGMNKCLVTRILLVLRHVFCFKLIHFWWHHCKKYDLIYQLERLIFSVLTTGRWREVWTSTQGKGWHMHNNVHQWDNWWSQGSTNLEQEHCYHCFSSRWVPQQLKWAGRPFVFCFCVLSQCIVSFFYKNLILFYQLHGDDVYISYLPLAHIFDRVIEEVFIRHGASIGFWRGVRIQNTCSILLLATFFISAIWSISILLQDVKLLVEDIGELKPTVFCAVPRVLDRIYGGILQFD